MKKKSTYRLTNFSGFWWSHKNKRWMSEGDIDWSNGYYSNTSKSFRTINKARKSFVQLLNAGCNREDITLLYSVKIRGVWNHYRP